MSPPEFSVIIPTYNRSADLSHCLNCLDCQTYKNFEVLVCDDGSTDNTKEVVDTFKGVLDIKYLYRENWGGPARPRNTGIKAASSDWICFLDSDDIWFPRKLERIKLHTEKYDVISHGLEIVRMGQHEKESVTLPLKHPVYDNLLMTENAIFNSSICVKKSILKQVNGVCEDREMIGVEDYDLLLNVAKITDNFIQLTENLGEYHINNSNIHQNMLKMYKGEMRVLGKHKEQKLYKQALKKRLQHYFPYLALFHKVEAVQILSASIALSPGFALGCALLFAPLPLVKLLLAPFGKSQLLSKYDYLFK